MSTIRGRDGVVKIGANSIAEVRDFSLNPSAEIITSRRKGDSGPKREVDGVDFSGSLKCWLDEDDTNGQDTLIEGASVTLLLQPDTSTTGKPQYTCPSIISDVSISSPESGHVEVSFNFVSSTAGGLTRGTVA